MADFSNIAVVSCGTLRQELLRLKEEGFLNAAALLFTPPGLHEWQPQLRQHLLTQLERASHKAPRVIVVYGKVCYLDPADPSGDVNWLIEQSGVNAVRINAANCVDILASKEERDRIAAGSDIYWLTPGWFLNWRFIFKDYDRGKANETFRGHDRAIMLDALGVFDQAAAEEPEKILEFSDFMGIPFEAHPVTLERFKVLLKEAAERLQQR